MTEPMVENPFFLYAPRVLDFSVGDPSDLPNLLVAVSHVLFVFMLFAFYASNRQKKMNTFVLLGVCLNISWEVFYILIQGHRDSYLVVWLILDLLILFQAYRYGAQQLKWSPMALRFFPLIFTLGLFVAIYLQTGYYKAYMVNGLILSAWIVNLVTSLAFNFYYINWPERKRHSIVAVWLRFAGNVAISAANLILMSRNPPGGPQLFVLYMIFVIFVADVTYLAMLHFRVFEPLRKMEA